MQCLVGAGNTTVVALNRLFCGARAVLDLHGTSSDLSADGPRQQSTAHYRHTSYCWPDKYVAMPKNDVNRQSAQVGRARSLPRPH